MPVAEVTDPGTFEGGVAIVVVGSLIVAAILGGITLVRRRGKDAGASRPGDDANRYLADLVTGLRQALMATRDAVEHFERYGVLVDPDSGTLEEGASDLLAEARRTVAEVEARLPRVELVIGRKRASDAHRCVQALRRTLTHLRNYIEQPGSGESWSTQEREETKDSLATANSRFDTFLTAATQN